MEETWKPVVGYEGLYSVSDMGRVKRDAPTHLHDGNRLLRAHVRSKGYYGVTLAGRKERRHRGCGGENKSVHTLVAEAFIGPKPSRLHGVNHINGDRLDNRACNLEWVTQKENQAHAVRFGLCPSGEKHHNHKLKDVDVINILSSFAGGENISPIAKRYAVAYQTIWAIVHNRSHRRRPTVKVETYHVH